MSKHNKIVAKCLLDLAKNTAITQGSGIGFFSSVNTAPNVAARVMSKLLENAPTIEATATTQEANPARA